MFPGFVTSFKDEESKIHLFFYPGISDDGVPIYRDLDLSKIDLEHSEIQYSDNSKEFIFERKNIVQIRCKLIKNDGTIDHEELNL